MSFELNTSIANLRDLRASDLGAYDAIYLGDIYCRLYEANFLERPDDLREGIRILREQGKRAYVATYAAPRNDFLPRIQKTLEVAAEAGAEAVEIHNLGVLKIAHDQFPGLPVHVGGFANVYTDAGVEVLRGFGAVRFTPNYELSLDEIRRLRSRADGLPSTGRCLGISVTASSGIREVGDQVPGPLPEGSVPEAGGLGHEVVGEGDPEREGRVHAGAPASTPG
jgi:collagenase-like PrtC family protease